MNNRCAGKKTLRQEKTGYGPMFNHQTHHRGQVTTLMKQLGAEPGVTDIPWLPRLNAEEGECKP
jgi:hypothetical protein